MFHFLRRLFGALRSQTPEPEKVGDRGGADARSSTPPEGPSGAEKPSGNDLIGPPESDSPIVVVAQGNMTMIMDRMGYEFQQGLRTGEAPSQASLESMLHRTMRVRALDGGVYREHSLGANVLFEEEDAAAIRGLIDAFKISEDPETFCHCMCLGGPTLEFFDDDELIATIAIHHGRSIRWPVWKHDAVLKDGRRLTGWLAARGIELGDGPSSPGDPMMMGLLSLKPAERFASRAFSYLRLGLPSRVLAELDLVEAIDPGMTVLPVFRTDALIALGKLDEGLATAEAAVGRGVREPQLFRALAVCLDSLGRTEEALAQADEAIAMDADHADARNTRATILARLGRMDEARVEYTEAARLAPDWILPAFHLALMDFDGGRPTQAVEYLTRSIEILESDGVAPAARVLGPHSIATLHAIRACCRIMLGDAERGLEDAERAIELDPEDANGYVQKGQALRMLGRPAEAAEAFEPVVRIVPDNPRAWCDLAYFHADAGSFEAALGAIDEVIRLQGEDPNLSAFKAQVFLRLDRFADAIEAAETAIDMRPDQAGFYVIRAECSKRLGDFERMFEDLQTARRWSPDEPMILNLLAWHLSTCPVDALRNGRLALDLAMRAVDGTEGRDSNILDTLAAALAENGRFPEARQRLRQAIELDPSCNQEARKLMSLAFEEGRPYRVPPTS
ncbi:tetratricopeptide repeat protein [Paludisphaera rhizosphaerae]|uniref:tetratricopeptide repeat protein n=1 Tax=Paludisphaera rhizosphaerae TaxID=2711216 RepID=UPI0013EC218A|nr:tetratricopeptide repeat protein [Paludisphaera rhizosphaerae]